MFAIFNADFGRRLEDLHAALAEGREIEVEFRSGYHHGLSHQPDRIVVGIKGSERRLTFSMDEASNVSDQIQANGFGEAASVIREAASAS